MQKNRRLKKQILYLILTLFCTNLLLTVKAKEEKLELYAKSAVLMDGYSGRVLYGKEEQIPLPMASTTKIMTCILALEKGKSNDVCTVSKVAASQPKVKLGMEKGDEFYLGDLLFSMMLESHNDSAVCIAETLGGSVNGFCEMMNEKAREIGCIDTYFLTPNGLDASDEQGKHHTTAEDLARIMRYCVSESKRAEDFVKVTQTRSYIVYNVSKTKSYSCINHNALLDMLDGAISGKTGFTGEAGYCYVCAISRGDQFFIIALLGCGWPNNKGYKWADTRTLLKYGLDQFEVHDLAEIHLTIPPIPVIHGVEEKVSAKLRTDSGKVLLRKGTKFQLKVECANALCAPVQQHEQIGQAHIMIDGKEYEEWPICTETAVEKYDYAFALNQVQAGFWLS